jgi:hypothetical protein
VFDDKRMALAAAGRREDDRLAAQRRWVKQVEEMLEQPGLAAFEGR